MEPQVPKRSGAAGGGNVTRTSFIEVGRELGIRGEEASRAYTRLVLHAKYLNLVMTCSQPPCRRKYCKGHHQIQVTSLIQADRGVLRDLLGTRSVTWRVLEQLLQYLER
jgi:hypothetical protein